MTTLPEYEYQRTLLTRKFVPGKKQLILVLNTIIHWAAGIITIAYFYYVALIVPLIYSRTASS